MCGLYMQSNYDLLNHLTAVHFCAALSKLVEPGASKLGVGTLSSKKLDAFVIEMSRKTLLSLTKDILVSLTIGQRIRILSSEVLPA